MTEQVLKKRLEQHLDELPTLPIVVAKLMALRPDDDRYVEHLVELLETEPTFSVRLIAAANSAASAPVRPITTVRGAVARIGATAVSHMIFSMAVLRVFVPRDDWEKSLWRHALQVAIASRSLALHGGVNPDEAYACGLLHDLGRFIMFQEAPDLLRRVDEGDWDTPDALIEEERRICGLTHTELGAIACARWKIPDVIMRVVHDHHMKLDQLPQGSSRDEVAIARLVATVRIADIAMFPSALPGTVGLEEADDATIEREVLHRLPRFIHVGLADLRDILRTSAAKANELAATLGVA